MLEVLHRVDEDRNMARFYGIDVTANLFGDVCVVRSWGRIGKRGRVSMETFATLDDAVRSAQKTLLAKALRGYVPAP